MAVFFVVANIQTRTAEEPALETAGVKLLEYEDSSNKFIGQRMMDAEVMKVECTTVAEAQKAAQVFGGGGGTTPVVVTEAAWKTS